MCAVACKSEMVTPIQHRSNIVKIKHRKSKSSLGSSCFCAHHSSITPTVNRLRAANSKSLNYLFPGGLGRGEGRQRIVSPDERVDEYKEIESKTSSYSVLHLRGLSTLVFMNKGLSVKVSPINLCDRHIDLQV